MSQFRVTPHESLENGDWTERDGNGKDVYSFDIDGSHRSVFFGWIFGFLM